MRKLKLQSHCEHITKQPNEIEQDKPIIDEKMLWTSSSNTQDKVKIKFSDKDKAIKFANNNNIDFVIIEPKKRKIKPKSYSDNFSPDRKNPWTH